MAPHALQIGQVGCGEWGGLVLRDLVLLGARVHVVARSEESRARAIKGGATSIVASADNLPEVEGIVVVLPTLAAPEQLAIALSRGVPVFTEKPLAADADTARRLALLGGDRLFVMDKWRYQPAIQYMAGVVAGGSLGAPLGLQTRRLGPRNPRRDVDIAIHLAPHDLAIAIEVLGGIPEPRTAVAHCDTLGVGGMTAILGDRPWMTLEVSARHEVQEREIRLHLEDGAIRLHSPDLEEVGVYFATTGSWHTERVQGEMPLLAELRCFLAHIEGGPPPRTGAAEAAEAVAVLETLRRMAGLVG